MARLSLTKKMHLVTMLILQLKVMQSIYHVLFFMIVVLSSRKGKNGARISYGHERLHRHHIRSLNLDKMLFSNDRQRVENCRMDRRTFAKLCQLLKIEGILKENRNMIIEEMVISFLHIIAHHMKNRVFNRQIARSGETVSRQFHAILKLVLRLNALLFKKPEPISENSSDGR